MRLVAHARGGLGYEGKSQQTLERELKGIARSIYRIKIPYTSAVEMSKKRAVLAGALGLSARPEHPHFGNLMTKVALAHLGSRVLREEPFVQRRANPQRRLYSFTAKVREGLVDLRDGAPNISILWKNINQLIRRRIGRQLGADICVMAFCEVEVFLSQAGSIEFHLHFHGVLQSDQGIDLKHFYAGDYENVVSPHDSVCPVMLRELRGEHIADWYPHLLRTSIYASKGLIKFNEKSFGDEEPKGAIRKEVQLLATLYLRDIGLSSGVCIVGTSSSSDKQRLVFAMNKRAKETYALEGRSQLYEAISQFSPRLSKEVEKHYKVIKECSCSDRDIRFSPDLSCDSNYCRKIILREAKTSLMDSITKHSGFVGDLL